MSKPVILLVEDNLQILKTLKLILELNHYHPVVATNGKQGLEMLAEMKQLPDIIISDIMMPEMDGYEFFKKISQNPKWIQIPFIFLTARAAPEDVRLGKMLGVDDYLTKPFQEEELLATIAGKLLKKEKIKSINERMNQLSKADSEAQKVETDTFIDQDWKDRIFLFVTIWDEVSGPIVRYKCPEQTISSFPIQEVAIQLFQSMVAIYGYADYGEAESLLLNIQNVNSHGYIYFDTFVDKEVRGGKRQFMIALIAPQITYFQSLKCKKLMETIAYHIKRFSEVKLQVFWNEIVEILTQIIE